MAAGKASGSGLLQLDGASWSRLSPLFDRALELEPESRPELLESIREESPDLAAALERLLVDHERASAARFLDEPIGEGELSTLAGKELGPYTLVRMLGAGGMGTVWRARRSDGRFEKDVAVKLLNLAMIDRAGEERFRREGMLLARLDHPNIARLLDAGVSAAGQPYLVLELVEGTLLDVHANANRLDVRARLELFAQAADAVAHAHANLVVHRDLKPSNILVDAGGRVKLLDFGVATLLDEASGLPASRTFTVGRALTPAYAAPEQMQGGAVTTATDVYALGVLLYELLTGRHPTAGRETTPAAFARSLVEVEPERASSVVAALRPGEPETARLVAERATTRDRLVRSLRGDLDNVLAKALRKRPTDRYAGAAALADEVRRHLLNQPVRARPESAWYRARKFVARHRLEVGAAGAAVFALAVGGILALAQARRSARERDRALAELRLAEVTNDLAAYLLSEATPEGEAVTKAELLARGEEMIERQYTDDPSLRVRLLLTLSERYYDNSQFDSWRRTVASAFELSRPLDEPGLRALAGCTFSLTAAEGGDFERAEALVSEALRELERAPESPAEEAQCRVIESYVAYFTGDAAGAVRAGERALALERSRGVLSAREREALGALGNAYALAGRLADADRTFGELIALMEADGLARTKAAANQLNSWAVALGFAGQASRSLEVSQRAVALSRELHAEAGALRNELSSLACSFSDVGRHAEALETMDEALRKARVEESHLGLFWTLGSASRVHFDAGRRESGEALLREIEAFVRELPEPPERILAALERFQARGALERGDPAEAVTLARRALDRVGRAELPARDRLAVELVLARALNRGGDFERAREGALAALASARELRGGFPHSLYVGIALLELGTALQGLGRPQEARAALAEAIENLRRSGGDASPDLLAATRGLAGATG